MIEESGVLKDRPAELAVWERLYASLLARDLAPAGVAVLADIALTEWRLRRDGGRR